jgi:hypothetical protein
MDIKNRIWFDKVYDFTQRGFPSNGNILLVETLPFGLFTGPLTKEDIKCFSNLGLDNKTLKEAKKFYKNLPQARDFLEEKERLYPQIKEYFQRLMPFVDTAITFGRIRGDIDIALISKDGTQREDLERAVEKNQLTTLFPIIDWNGLYWFYSTNGLEVYNKMIQSQQMIKEKLFKSLKENVEKPIEGARLLYGNEEELSRMNSPFDYKRNKDGRKTKSILSFLSPY